MTMAVHEQLPTVRARVMLQHMILGADYTIFDLGQKT